MNEGLYTPEQRALAYRRRDQERRGRIDAAEQRVQDGPLGQEHAAARAAVADARARIRDQIAPLQAQIETLQAEIRAVQDAGRIETSMLSARQDVASSGLATARQAARTLISAEYPDLQGPVTASRWSPPDGVIDRYLAPDWTPRLDDEDATP